MIFCLISKKNYPFVHWFITITKHCESDFQLQKLFSNIIEFLAFPGFLELIVLGHNGVQRLSRTWHFDFSKVLTFYLSFQNWEDESAKQQNYEDSKVTQLQFEREFFAKSEPFCRQNNFSNAFIIVFVKWTFFFTTIEDSISRKN